MDASLLKNHAWDEGTGRGEVGQRRTFVGRPGCAVWGGTLQPQFCTTHVRRLDHAVGPILETNRMARKQGGGRGKGQGRVGARGREAAHLLRPPAAARGAQIQAQAEQRRRAAVRQIGVGALVCRRGGGGGGGTVVGAQGQGARAGSWGAHPGRSKERFGAVCARWTQLSPAAGQPAGRAGPAAGRENPEEANGRNQRKGGDQC